MSKVELSCVRKSYGQAEVLRGIDLVINAGEQCVIRGASGSGKSTFLYLLGGLETVTSGNIYIAGKDLAGQSEEQLADFRNREIGFVFQFHFLLPSMNCLNNILLPARIGRANLKEVQKRIVSLAGDLGVRDCLEKFPYQLSGGEQQRINIVRALSLHPKLLLCDEPTGNLDSKNSEKVTVLLKELASAYNSTLLVVTHDAKVASMLDREILIEDGVILRDSAQKIMGVDS